MMWQLWLAGVDITGKADRVLVSLAAENMSGQIIVDLADRSVLDGIITPRVPREPLIAYRHSPSHPTVHFFLEEPQKPESLDARRATIRGRTTTARLAAPWAQSISKQWAAATTIDAIVQELAEMRGVTVEVQNNFPVCQYCYAVSAQQPSEIIRDLATKSGQIFWPRPDGSLRIAPRLYTYGTPDVVLEEGDVVVESVVRTVPDFGNRILISGDGAVAGIVVQVVVLDDSTCLAADGRSTRRVLAVATGSDGEPLAAGTEVTWSCSGGLMESSTSIVQSVAVIGEEQKATDFNTVLTTLPIASVIGIYARSDYFKRTNLYDLLRGSFEGNVISVATKFKFYDQSLVIDYTAIGAPAVWAAGRTPGEVRILASVAGAQGSVTVHQSNPTACGSEITVETSPDDPCLGDSVAILVTANMFGGAGMGTCAFSLSGCGSLSSTRKVLKPREVTIQLRSSDWGGASEVTLPGYPVSGEPITVIQAGDASATNLYAAVVGKRVQLSTQLPQGTACEVTYTAGGTALIAWTPTGIPAGEETIIEDLTVSHAEVEGVTVAQVQLSRTPSATSTPDIVWVGNHIYVSHDENNVATLADVYGSPLAEGETVMATYASDWTAQADCEARIDIKVEDGSEDGGKASVALIARDCRDGSGLDEADAEDESDDDPTHFDHDDDEEEEDAPLPTGCDVNSIATRTPTVTIKTLSSAFGVSRRSDCPGTCTCDQICHALQTRNILSKAGLSYAQCIAACNDTREEVCADCELSGPTELKPGATGVWTDGRTNSGDVSGDLVKVSRDFTTGYTLRMPTGGAGPFKVKVCYSEDESNCCEAQVDFPPCSLSGPSSLTPGTESLYTPSAGMDGASCVCSGDMELVRTQEYAGLAIGFVCRMKPGGCEGTVTVSYAGVVCEKIQVVNPKQDYVGVVVGQGILEPGEVAVYYHDLGPEATYAGTLPKISDLSGESGNGATLMMPVGAVGTYEVKWEGVCGSSASMTVVAGGGDNLIGTIAFPATGTSGSLTSPNIGAGDYYVVNDSWVNFWPLVDGHPWSNGEANLSYSVVGNTLTITNNDDVKSDNSGTFTFYVYRTAA
jgi:hypothetical protein